MIECFFIANNGISDVGLSGGDRIFVELARRWSRRVPLSIVGSEDTLSLCRRENLEKVTLLSSGPKLGLRNVFTLRAIFENTFKKLIYGVRFVRRNKKIFCSTTPVVYSVSDFTPDFLPAFLIKRMNPRARWVAAFFLFAPAPWAKNSPYKGFQQGFRGFLYWLSQRLAFCLVNSAADYVFVTSEPDQKRFVTKRRDISRVVVVKGGVVTDDAVRYFESGSVVPPDKRTYDACFVGRFHVQKGVMALLEAWREVLRRKPRAKLAMIGNGPLEAEARRFITQNGMEQNVDLLGFLDGPDKFAVFKQSRLVAHPATFDSGGMAAAEAMAWRLPGVSFDLEALKTYYPKGMVKVPVGDLKAFGAAIITLLDNPAFYAKMAEEAFDHAHQDWSWDKRAALIFETVFRGV
jgi:glycosyltransferase involved in cell wall biosynthesis